MIVAAHHRCLPADSSAGFLLDGLRRPAQDFRAGTRAAAQHLLSSLRLRPVGIGRRGLTGQAALSSCSALRPARRAGRGCCSSRRTVRLITTAKVTAQACRRAARSCRGRQLAGRPGGRLAARGSACPVEGGQRWSARIMLAQEAGHEVVLGLGQAVRCCGGHAVTVGR